MVVLKSLGRKIMNKGKLVAASSAVVLTTAGSAIAASAEGGATTGLEQVINAAGDTLKEQFTTLVQTLCPILVSIGVTALGMFAIVYLFKMCKSFFKKAAG